MLISSIMFLLGILLFLSQKKILFTCVILSLLFVVILAKIFISKKINFELWVFALPAGFLIAMLHVHYLLAFNLNHNIEGKSVLVKGDVISMPIQKKFGKICLFRLKLINGIHVTSKIVLFYKNNYLKMRVGDSWQLKVKLKRVHGLRNPGGLDVEAIKFASGVRARGYVVNDKKNTLNPDNKLISHHWYIDPIDQVREVFIKKLKDTLGETKYSVWLAALTFGDRRNISQDNWEVLRKTGTNHLMVIAGLHLGFVSGGVFFLVKQVWRRLAFLCLLFPAEFVAGLLSLFAGVIYGVLSGFLLPARRACIMLSICMLGVLLKRKILPWHAWSVALWAILFLDPMSVLTVGFWLSFCSVALIIFTLGGRIRKQSLWRRVSGIQLATSFGLMPLSIWLFKQYSIISVVANTIAVPWMGMLILPFTILGSVFLVCSSHLSKIFFWIGNFNLLILWDLLKSLSHISFASFEFVEPSIWRMLSICCGVVLLLFPVGFPYRVFSFAFFMPIFNMPYISPEFGKAIVTLLDVGQGLSIVVQTNKHILVYDTGPSYGKFFDAGRQVVIPFLQYNGVKSIDSLIVSHADNDHSGGAAALLDAFNVHNFISSAPLKVSRKPTVCLDNKKWLWDGVEFAFVYPSAKDLHDGNNSSCVLKIIAKNGKSILFTGDIEKKAEIKLLNRHKNISADVIVVPHHGSKTSSGKSFVISVSPVWALFSLGYLNRYHFPHYNVLRRYKNLNINILSTDKDGAIEFILGEESINIKSFRRKNHYIWND